MIIAASSLAKIMPLIDANNFTIPSSNVLVVGCGVAGLNAIQNQKV